MKPKLLSAVIWFIACAIAVAAQTTSFIYQGRLTDGGTPANGNYDLQFALFDSLTNGTQVGSTQVLNTVAVSNGVFTVSLDFGANAFPGANRFLEISARPSGGGSFTLLSPRQPITPTPYAIRSLNATSADSVPASGVPAGSGNYIQNSNSQQASSNFNIGGNGTAAGTLTGNIVNATTQYNLNGSRILSNAGTRNLFAGVGAGTANTNGTDDTFIGFEAGKATIGNPGRFNTFVGSQAGTSNTTGSLNSFFGSIAGLFNTEGSHNTFLGNGAGTANVTGTGNTIIGSLANLGSDGLINATAIGSGAQVNASNALVLGNNANVGIGTTAPTAKLSVIATGDGARVLHLGTERAWVFKQLGTGAATALELTTDNPTNPKDFVITGNNVGIGTTSPQAKLDVNGGARFVGNTLVNGKGEFNNVQVHNLLTGTSTAVCRRNSDDFLSFCSSSLRYKKDVNSFGSGLDIISHLRPIAFTWKEDGIRDIGLAAEEVEKVEPLLTFRNDKGEIEGVRYNQLSAVFINAFKEQQAQIEKQQELLREQQEQLAALKKLVCRSHRLARVCR